MTKARRVIPPEETVRKLYPNAFVDDDGEWVRIRNQKTVTEPCPHCKQSWTHMVTDYSDTLGAGNSEAAAWKDAAKTVLRRTR